jgi:SAM-dependent methyltransferase
MAEINLLHRYPRIKRDFSQLRGHSDANKKIASRFGREYFDGDRSTGYGGYRYDGRWVPVAETFRDHWDLRAGDRVLDIGCAKGFLLKDLMTAVPGIDVTGVDISQYAVDNCLSEVMGRIQVGNAKSLPFPDHHFKAVICINTIHNLPEGECIQAIREIQRVSGGRAYIQVDSWHTPQELENLHKWVLTCVTVFDPDGWKRLFKQTGYTGDYYWTIAE